MDRRTFIKATSIAGASLAIASGFSSDKAIGAQSKTGAPPGPPRRATGRSTRILCDEGFKNFSTNGVVRGYKVQMGVSGYRGMYISCIEHLSLSVDNQKVNPDIITFCINGKRFLLSQLPDLYAEYWFTLDRAELEVYKPGGLKPGKHEVEIEITTRSPYSNYDYTRYRTGTTIVKKTLTLGS
jgi:hypothetical protein